MSALLRDGSVVWFFGDTARLAADGSLLEFEIGTAAWAPSDHPTETADPRIPAIDAFAEPTEDFPDCPPGSPVAGMWPLSAVVEHVGARDRVVVFMQNICLGNSADAVARGVSVGEWIYDPADPPDGRLVTVNILNQGLFPDGRYGTAAFAEGDIVYTYGCKMPPTPNDYNSYGPCRVARTSFATVADAGSYEIWDGSNWRAGGVAADMDLPPLGTGEVLPPGPFSVMWHEASDRHVMVYSPWPGYVGLVAIRFAAHPEGPWSAPHLVSLQGCEDVVASARMSCYGANVQPAFTTATRLALGYQDQSSGDERRGEFLLTTVRINRHRE